MLCVDFHCHTVASVHAMNTLEEMLRFADRKGIQGVAITDHCPGLDNTLWIINRFQEKASWQGIIKSADLPYFKTFLSRYQAPEELNVKLFKGIECNILEEGERATDIPLILAAGFDLIIASLHPIPALFKSKDRSVITDRLLLAMEEPMDVLGHPFQKGYCPHPQPVINKALEMGLALELNNSALSLKKADLVEVAQMLTLAKKIGCQISLASDSHAANELGGDIAIRQMLAQVDFPSGLIVNDTLEKAERFIQSRKEVRKKLCADQG